MATLRWLAKSNIHTESPIYEFEFNTCADAVDEYNQLLHMHMGAATPASIVLEVRDNSGVMVRHFSYASRGDQTMTFDHKPRR